MINLALLRAFRRSPIDFLDLLVSSGASEEPLRVGPERVLLLDDPTQVRELLTVHARRTQKGRGLVRARLLLGDGLLTSEGEAHLRQRRALSAAFHPKRIADYLGSFAAAARRAADRWSDGAEIDLVGEMSALTLDGVGTALFGTDLHGSTPQITHALADMLAGFRLAMAPGGVVLLRTPLPPPGAYAGPRPNSSRSLMILYGSAPVSQPANQLSWTCSAVSQSSLINRPATR